MAPVALYVPGAQKVHSPNVFMARPGSQSHRAAAPLLLLPAGHGVHSVSPALLYVSAGQAVQFSVAPEPDDA